jgi:hypothetical protein
MLQGTFGMAPRQSGTMQDRIGTIKRALSAIQDKNRYKICLQGRNNIVRCFYTIFSGSQLQVKFKINRHYRIIAILLHIRG